MKTKRFVCCFGEVLWDVFPDGKQIGGAPLNVALRLSSFGVDTSILSAVGKDELGDEALTYIKERGLDISYIQRNELPTGNVPVVLDKKGSATYTIAKPVAWDNISYDEYTHNKIISVEVFIYGSLACRSELSRATLHTYLDMASGSFKVFDINLRAPHYEKEVLFNLMRKADLIKFNDEELPLICAMESKAFDTIEDQISFISDVTNTPSICVTLGHKGALLYQNGSFYRHTGYQVTVADTVGAGDSFLAGLIFQLLDKQTPEKALDFACAIGALVASKTGANEAISVDEIERLSI